MSETAVSDMPSDWWPESVIVIGKSGDVELAFAISEENRRFVEWQINANLDGLRKAIWQAKMTALKGKAN